MGNKDTKNYADALGCEYAYSKYILKFSENISSSKGR